MTDGLTICRIARVALIIKLAQSLRSKSWGYVFHVSKTLLPFLKIINFTAQNLVLKVNHETLWRKLSCLYIYVKSSGIIINSRYNFQYFYLGKLFDLKLRWKNHSYYEGIPSPFMSVWHNSPNRLWRTSGFSHIQWRVETKSSSSWRID